MTDLALQEASPGELRARSIGRVLLALCAAVGVSVTGLTAARAQALAVQSAAGEPGAVVEVDVQYTPGSVQASGFQFDVVLPSPLALESATIGAGGLAAAKTVASNGTRVIVIGPDNANVVGGGVLVVLRLAIAGDAAEGTLNVGLSEIIAASPGSATVPAAAITPPLTASDGTVTVAVTGCSAVSDCIDGDGCCPDGCNATTDDNCSPICGNAVIEGDEVCDDNCPTSCDDGVSCTTDGSSGSSSDCDLVCSNIAIVACAHGDGCCPAGCDTANDDDCSATCDDGTVDSNETCDPPASCPTSCDDQAACTKDTLTGSAANCNVECSHVSVTQCVDDDGCCPAGCSSLFDDDCAGGGDAGVDGGADAGSGSGSGCDCSIEEGHGGSPGSARNALLLLVLCLGWRWRRRRRLRRAPVRRRGALRWAGVTLLVLSSCADRAVPARERPYAPGELIVRYRLPARLQHKVSAHSPLSRRAARFTSRSLERLDRRYRLTRAQQLFRSARVGQWYRLSLDAAHDMEAVARDYAADPAIEQAHPNYALKVAAVPNDTRYDEQWAHQKIAAEAGWDLGTGGSATVIAVVDTGVDWDHPDLAANIWRNPDETPGNGIDDDNNGYIDDVRGWDFVDVTNASSFDPAEDIGPADNDPMDFLGHGTAVAGVAAGHSNNGRGISGVCWQCRIMPLRVGVTQRELEVLGGRAYVLVSWMAEAVRYAADEGADVINLSITDNNWPSVLREAIDYAHDADAVVVASAGNHASGQPSYPAAYGDVIAVAATNSRDERSIWGVPQPPLYAGNASNYGTWVDVAAPGTGILSTTFNDGYASASGTSLAAAHVAGLAGLIRSLRPSFDREQVARAIGSTTDPVTSDQYIGSGRINLAAALRLTEVPLATITAPVADQVVGGASVAVVGSAGGAGFASYSLRYGRGLYPSSWTEIRSATTAVSDATLATWDLQPLQDNAAYTLQLRVTDGAGNTSAAEVLLYVQKSVAGGWPVALADRVFGDGIVIGNVDPADTALEVAAVARRSLGNGNNTNDLHLLNHDGSSVRNWPRTSLNRELGPPTLADVTGDGSLEVVVGGFDYGHPTEPVTFHVFSHTGSYVPGWPQIVRRARGHRSHAPAVADLDDDGTLELVFTSQMHPPSGPGRTAYIDVYQHDGTPVAGWAKAISLGFPEGTGSAAPPASQAALADLDNDGRLEVVVGLNRYNAAELRVYHHDGNVMAGWPKTFGNGFTPQPIVADVDADGDLEVIASHGGGAIGIWRGNGEVYPGWPQSVRWGAAAAPAVADLDGDGDLEVIVYYTADEVAAYHHDGTPLSGWPVAGTELIGGTAWPTSVVADVTGDDRPEVIQGSGDEALIYGWQSNGQQLSSWPKTIPQVMTVAPAAGDLDDDGTLDLVVAAQDTVFVIDLGVAPSAVHWPMSRFDAQHTARYRGPADLLRGDLNADGQVNAVDLQLLVNVVRAAETTPTIVARADLNGSGQANRQDIQLLTSIILGGR